MFLLIVAGDSGDDGVIVIVVAGGGGGGGGREVEIQTWSPDRCMLIYSKTTSLTEKKPILVNNNF